jgi:hypothetical protein
MKHISLVGLLVFAIAIQCYGQSDNDNSYKIGISYIFNGKIDSLFRDKLTSSSYFCLSDEGDFYQLTIGDSKNKLASLTNRRVFMYGKTYPLIFDLDMEFGSSTPDSTLKRQYTETGYLEYEKDFSTLDGFFVKFKKGPEHEILGTGYGIFR